MNKIIEKWEKTGLLQKLRNNKEKKEAALFLEEGMKIAVKIIKGNLLNIKEARKIMKRVIIEAKPLLHPKLSPRQIAYLKGDLLAIKDKKEIDELEELELVDYDPFIGHGYPIPTELGKKIANQYS